MREPLSPYKSYNNINYLCIIVTELLGQTNLRDITMMVSGFESVVQTLPSNVIQAIINVRLANIAPWSNRELRIMVEEYNESYRKLERQRQAKSTRQNWLNEDEPQEKLQPKKTTKKEENEIGLRFIIDDQFNVRRAWTQVIPNDIKQAIAALTSALPLRARSPRIAHNPALKATVRSDYHEFSAAIQPIDFVAPPSPVYDMTRVPRAPGFVSWDDLVAIADRFDAMDEGNGRQKHGQRSWYFRLHDPVGRKTAQLLGAAPSGLEPIEGLSLTGIKHLIGLPGSGKTTLLYLVAAWMHERDYKTCFLFPSIEVSTGFSETLSHYGINVSLLFGQSDRARTKHVANFGSSLANVNHGFGVTRSTAHYFATNCALASFASEEETAFPHDQPPCQNIYQDNATPQEGKRLKSIPLQCHLSSVCGRQHAERSLVSSTIWAGHILSTDRDTSALYNDVRVRQFELIARTFDLLVVDECDAAQSNLDARGSPLMKLSGDTDSVWNHLLMDLHAPAAQGKNAFVAGLTIPAIMAMSGRFGTAAERLTACIIHSSTQFRKENENQLLTSLSILSDMFPDPFTISDASLMSEIELVFGHRQSRQALERIWDIAAKRVAFRERFELIAASDNEDKQDGLWSDIEATQVEGDDDQSTQEIREINQLAQLMRVDSQQINDYIEKIHATLERWDINPKESTLLELAGVLKGAPGLSKRKDEPFFNEYVNLLTNVTLLVLQHFGLAPHLRLLNSQGILGDDVFESRPSKEMLSVVPESLVGRLSGVRFSIGDEGDVDIAHIGFSGTPRLLLERIANFPNKIGTGPALLLTSATSLLEHSPSFHVNVGPHYVLQRPDAGTGWEKSKYKFLPLKDPSDDRKVLYFSGSKMSRREHVLKTMVNELLADGVLGIVENAMHDNDIVDAVGRKAAFVVNSYDQCEMLYEHIKTHHPAWRSRVRYLTRAGVKNALPEQAITASNVESLGEDDQWDLFIFPMSAIGRGVNIVYKFGARHDKAMIGSLFFLTRPHPRADSLNFLQGIVGRASEEFDHETFATFADAITAIKSHRSKASAAVSNLLRMPQTAKAMDMENAKAFIADQMIMILQTIGRTMRGDCPAFIYFVDGAWAPNSTRQVADTAKTSMLLMMRQILLECLAHPEPAVRQCYENLYQSFLKPLSRIEGVTEK